MGEIWFRTQLFNNNQSEASPERLTMISKHLLKEQKKIYTTKKSTLILKTWKCHPILTSRNVCYRTPRLVKGMSTIGKEWQWMTQWLEEKLLLLWWNKCVCKWLLSTLIACRANQQGYRKHPPFISYLPEWMAASQGHQMKTLMELLTSQTANRLCSCETTPEEIILYWGPVKSGGEKIGYRDRGWE